MQRPGFERMNSEGTIAHNAYQTQQQYHHPNHYQHPQSYNHGAPQYTQAPIYSNNPLKPTQQTTTTTTAHSSAPSYTPIAPDSNLARLDALHKRRIRILKALARVIATLLSLATFIPLALTLAKFFETKDEVLVVDGEERTAWASGTITWYTYLYTAVALISLLLNAAVLLSYCCSGHRGAEKVATVESWWTNLQRGVEVLVWIASVAIYRYGKEPDLEGKFKDLWGWTCSPAAEAIQSQVTNVDFETYCTVQTASFYTGVLHVLALILTGCIYIYALVRWRSKSKLGKATMAMEPLRH